MRTAQTPTGKWHPWWAGLLVAGWLAGLAIWQHEPRLSQQQTLQLILDASDPGVAEPLIVTGRTGRAEILYLRRAGADKLVIGYDQWGARSEIAQPVSYAPHTPLRVAVTFPALEAVPGLPRRAAGGILRVAVNDVEVMRFPHEPVLRAPHEVWFGRNPIGGSVCGPGLHGILRTESGVPFTGANVTSSGAAAKATAWLAAAPWQFVAVVLAGLVAAIGFARWQRAGQPSEGALTSLGKGMAKHRVFLGSTAVSLVVFLWFLTGGSGRLFHQDVFGNFYDHQALSLLAGRLDVPDEAIGGEAFVHEGKRYGYFGPTPALLRLPAVVFGWKFGEWTRISMLSAYLVALVGAYRLLRRVHGYLRPDATAPSGAVVALITIGVGLGSTLLFLGSRAYVYHEAILWGAALALCSAAASTSHFAAPKQGHWRWALVLGIGAVHARAPSGFFALSLLGAMAMAAETSNANGWRWRRWLIPAAALGGILSFNALSYAKFKTIDGCPLRLNVQYTPARLARIDGQQFHLSNIPFTFDLYFRRQTTEVDERFPWFHLKKVKVLPDYPNAKMDLPDPTVAIPYAMTGLTCLALLGGVAAWRRKPPARRLLVVVAVAALPMTLALLAAIATAHRYTADFVPVLVVAAAIGAAGIDEWVRGRRWLLASLVIAAVWAAAINALLAFDYQWHGVWGVPEETQATLAHLAANVDAFFHATKQ